MKRMKRVLLLTGLLALASSATAGAFQRHYSGPAVGGGSVEFIAKINVSDPRAVIGFQWHDIPANCNEGRNEISGGISYEMGVRRMHFKTTEFSARGRAHVQGHFNSDIDTTAGWLEVRHDYGGLTNCRTGEVRWSAQRD